MATHDSGIGAAYKVAAFEPDTMLLDMNLPGVDGLEVLQQFTSHDSRPPVIAFTGHGTFETAVPAMQTGASRLACLHGYLIAIIKLRTPRQQPEREASTKQGPSKHVGGGNVFFESSSGNSIGAEQIRGG